MSQRESFEALLGQYWALAYDEGRHGVSHGDKANKILHSLKEYHSSVDTIDQLRTENAALRAELAAPKVPAGWQHWSGR